MLGDQMTFDQYDQSVPIFGGLSLAKYQKTQFVPDFKNITF